MGRILLFCCLFLLGACFEKGDCLVTNTTLVKVKLKSLKTRNDTTFLFSSVKNMENVALYSVQSLSTLELPVNPKKNEYAFYLVQEDRKDTLIFSYYSETIVLSPECGAYDFLKGLAVTRNTFELDSAKVLNNQLIRSVATNVEIYF